MKRVMHVYEQFLPDRNDWSLEQLRAIRNFRLVVAAPRLTGNHPKPRDIRFLKFFRTGSRRLDRIFYWWALKRAVRKKSVHLLHAHFGYVGYELLDIRRKYGIPLLVSFYGFDYENLPHEQPEWRERYQEMFEVADGFITEGPYGKMVLEKMGCHPSRIHVVPLGLKDSGLERKRKPFKSSQVKFLQVSALRPKKGIESTLRAFSILIEKFKDASLTIVGPDDRGLLQEYKELSETLMIDHRVAFLDAIPSNKLNDMLDRFDIFVHPSRLSETMDSEGGYPFVLLHAMDRGLPIVSTTHCDIPFVVEERVNGLLAQEFDLDGLAGAMIELASLSPEEFEKYSQAGLRILKEKFSPEACSRKLEAVYYLYLS